MPRTVPLLLLLAAGLAASCSSRTPGGVAVTIVRNPEAVRSCAFLGTVRASDTLEERDVANEGTLRQRAAEFGGNVLLLLPRGGGEVYDCKGKAIVYREPVRTPRTPVGLIPAARTPTPGSWPTGIVSP